MRTIHADIITQIQSGEIRNFIIMHLDVGAGIYITTCDAPIYIGAQKYTPWEFAPSDVTYSIGTIVDQATITIDNTDDSLTTTFVGGTVQKQAVEVQAVWLDSNYEIEGSAVTLFEGEIGPWNLREGRIEITITNRLSQWNQRTFNQHTSICRWKVFKGTECGYSGSETECNRSYDYCAGLSSGSNVANFGGFRWMPSLERKVVWWGSIPDTARNFPYGFMVTGHGGGIPRG